jgi:hypothetical protein
MREKIVNRKGNLRKSARQMPAKDKRNLIRPDSKLLTFWHKAAEKGRLEIIITAVAGLIVGIIVFFMLLR